MRRMNINLPEGFSLKEDPHFVHLYYQDKLVGTFSASGVNPELIKREAEKYLRLLAR